ncbi:MAG: formylglycine-generating enzyme family protein [Scytonema sp. PMC 1070.18]|nr:formylglycine-generating enzyme family protein [Scytonema sp. PMC 1070.18]
MNLDTAKQEQQRAEQMVNRFEARFQPSYRLLAYHAALPLVLTPELVNFLRVQFLRGEVPWVAEVDLLLSDLCRQVGYELYAMDTAVRAYLLKEMEREENLGKQRMQDVAKVLISYVKYLHQTNPYISPQELQAQQWSAMVYVETQREKAVSEITQAFQNAASQPTSIGQSLVNRAEMARLARITQELAPQLSAYENLIKYAEDVTKALTGTEVPNRSYSVAGMELSLPPELRGEQPTTTLPPLQEFEFQVATVQVEEKRELFGLPRKNEIKIIRRPGRARFFVEDLGDGISLEMVEIPGGTFTMGAPEDEEGSSDDERPQHRVTVQPFFMGKYPVTQAQWRAVAALPKVERDLKANPSRFKGDRLPVESVSWYDAVEFCARLSKYSEREYRLPSEAEWEYACRAGTTTPFNFGETITTDLANYQGTDNKEYNWKGSYGKGPLGVYRKETTEVGFFPANAFGLYDMHGNVWEWCADSWHDNYRGAPNNGSAWIQSIQNDNDNQNNQTRLLRGGSWYNYPDYCRSANRDWYTPDLVDVNFGFRVVCGGVAPS